MNKDIQEPIVFTTFNPYSPICNQTRVVPRETLNLIKFFRSKDIPVIIEPDDGSKINYTTEKGFQDLISNPIILAIASNVLLPIAINLISSYIHDYLNKRKYQQEVKFVIETSENGQKIRYSHKGEKIADSEIQKIIEVLENRQQGYAAQKLLNPKVFASTPFPVFLEHTDKVVGWAENFHVDGNGLVTDDIRITDQETRERVKKGELQGVSIGGVVTHSICSICKKEYVDCNHLSGNQYHRYKCSVEIKGMCIADISIVKYPVNPRARLEAK